MPKSIVKLKKNNSKDFLNDSSDIQVPCILLHLYVSLVPHLTLKNIINDI